MIVIRAEIIIHCRKIRIWEYVSDPDNAPEWNANVQSVEWKTAKPARLGSRIAFTTRFLRRLRTYTYEITEWVPLEYITLKAGNGPFPVRKISFRSLREESARVTLYYSSKASRSSRLFSRFTAWAIRKAARRDLKHLKAILEECYGCDPLDVE